MGGMAQGVLGMEVGGVAEVVGMGLGMEMGGAAEGCRPQRMVAGV